MKSLRERLHHSEYGDDEILELQITTTLLCYLSICSSSRCGNEKYLYFQDKGQQPFEAMGCKSQHPRETNVLISPVLLIPPHSLSRVGKHICGRAAGSAVQGSTKEGKDSTVQHYVFKSLCQISPLHRLAGYSLCAYQILSQDSVSLKITAKFLLIREMNEKNENCLTNTDN